MIKLPEPGIKERLRDAIAHTFETDLSWPKTLRRPTLEEARAIAEMTILVVVGFVEWVEEKIKIEMEKASLQVPGPFVVPSEDCEDCKEAARHANSDATTPGFFYDKCERHRKIKEEKE